MTGQRDVLRGFGNSAINALMLQAAAEVRACREVIREAGPDMAGDLIAYSQAYAASANGTVMPSRRAPSLRNVILGRLPGVEMAA